jgi:hypothetical protein
MSQSEGSQTVYYEEEDVAEQIEDFEEYRQIGGYAGYSVSNLGNVQNNRTGRILRGSLNSSGYLKLNLYVDGVKSTKLIHKLVASAFIGDSEGEECDHIDRNKQNNHASNLRYCSSSENKRNKNSYNGRRVEYLDELPDGSEPIIEIRGRTVAGGYYRNNNEFYVKVVDQHRRLTQSRDSRNSWRVQVRGPNGERISINWTD